MAVRSSSPSFNEGATFATTGAFVDDLQVVNCVKTVSHGIGPTFSWDSLEAFLVLVLVLVQALASLLELVWASALALAFLQVVWRKHLEYKRSQHLNPLFSLRIGRYNCCHLFLCPETILSELHKKRPCQFVTSQLVQSFSLPSSFLLSGRR